MSNKSSLQSQKVVLLSDDALAGSEKTITGNHASTQVELHQLDSPDANNGTTDTADDASESDHIEFLSPFDEFKTILRITLLVSGSLLFEFGPQIVANILVGHYYDNQMKDDEYLSAIGLTTVFNFMSAAAIVWGMHTGLYTLIPQAAGIPDIKNRNLALKIYSQRATVICTIVSIPLMILQYFAGDILIGIGEPSDLKQKIHYYALTLAPYVPILAYISILQRVFQALDQNTLLTSVNAVGCAVTYPFFFFLVDTCQLGFIGVGIGQILIIVFQVLIISVLAIIKGYGFLFKPIEFNVLLNYKETKEYVLLSLPGMVQNGFEWIIIQLGTILSGYVGSDNEHTTSISSSVIMYNLYLILVSFAYGMANGVNISVAKYIASGPYGLDYAKRSAKIGYFICLGLSCFWAILLASCAHVIPYIWTHNKNTVKLASNTIYGIAFWSFFLIHNQFIGSLYRALGFQKISARFVVGSYYALYLPILFILLFGAS